MEYKWTEKYQKPQAWAYKDSVKLLLSSDMKYPIICD